MCGFAGIINSSRYVTKAEVGAAAQSVSFRGPDSCGIRVMDKEWKETEQGGHAVFFNRLAIIDLDPRSDQPFEDERYLLIFNGEIYNYQELKEQLEGDGVHFKTTSDTEVLFLALKRWGKKVLPRLNGMFAFFWVDKKEQIILLSRDRLGIKPLYYYHRNKTLIFGSELDSIARFCPEELRISSKAVDMYLWLQFVPTPYTILENIFKMPPGSYIETSIDTLNREVTPQFYWNAYDSLSKKETASPASFENVIKDSLKRQLHADVPLGLFLSSGVDSSLLASMVNKYFASDNDVNFFTVKFSEATFSDESTDAEAFIKGFNNPRLINHTLEVNPMVMQNCLEDLYTYYDEPFGDPASLLNWVISRKAKEYVTVAISGDGADELFWGYDRYNRWQKFTNWNKLPLVPATIRQVAKRLPESQLKYNLQFVTEADSVQRHFNFFLPSGMRFKISDSILKYPMWSTEGCVNLHSRKDISAILDLKTYLADAMLYKVDRSSMASSLEVRVPYLDNEVVDFALQLPLSEKSNAAFKNKALLKDLLIKLAPHYNVNRPKKGFNFPLKKWLKESWKERVLDIMNKDDLETAGLDSKTYMKIVTDFYAKDTPYFTDVWYIYNLMLWIRKFKKLHSANA